MNVFGEKVKQRMAELGMNQKELALKTGLAQSTTSYYLKNKRYLPTLETLERFADALNVSIDYFLQEQEPVDNKTKVNSLTKSETTNKEIYQRPKGPRSKETQPHEIAKEILSLFDKYELSFGEVFETITIVRKNTMKMAALAANNIPYQRISGGT